MNHLSKRVEEFYMTDCYFIIRKNPYNQYTLTINVGGEYFNIQEVFSTTETVKERIKWCGKLGLEGEIMYE